MKNHRLEKTTALTLLLLASLVTPRAARAQRVLVGGPAVPTTAAKRGRFTVGPGHVTPQRGKGYWIATRSTLGDGALIAHFRHGRRRNVAWLLRGELDGEGNLIRGLVLRVYGRRMWLARLASGALRAITDKRWIRWTRARTLKITARLMGGWALVRAYVGRRGRTVSMLHAELSGADAASAPLPRGVTGLLALERRHDRRLQLRYLAFRQLCRTVPEHGGPWLTFSHPASDSATLRKIGAQRGIVRLEQLERPTPRVVFRTNPNGLERAYCAGARPLGLRSEMPLKYVDLPYLDLRGLPPSQWTATKLSVKPKGLRWRKRPKRRGLVRLDLSFKNPQMIYRLLARWHRRHPMETRLLQLGRSHQGRAIWALVVGSRRPRRTRKPAVLLNSAHHGNEPMSVEMVLDAAQTLLENPRKNPRVARWRDALVTWIVPVVNPDGLWGHIEHSRRSGRKNGRDLPDKEPGDTRTRGVDLNRNYPLRWGAAKDNRISSGSKSHHYYRGPKPASEPETRAMMRLVRRERFAASISYHAGSPALLVPYTIDGLENPAPHTAWKVGEELVDRVIHPHLGNKELRLKRQLYPVEGTDQDWIFHETGALAFLLECSKYSPLNLAHRRHVVAQMRPVWQRLFDRFLDGPSLSGHIVDAQGKPVRALVKVREIKLRAGETWQTRKRDGRFDRYLPAPGQYTIDVSAKGYAPKTRVVRVKSHRVVKIVLQRRGP
ncbi:MAG: hypothetical protein CSA24_00820 [Deltaproteobacteria bacterium]|nr:MAG: hypothetical protein CSB49_00980 [Pseudomonadota bacterium]PIE66201.1 MAG: hypothetical protein CSA24_00820 [Deltaproteobacteria bacterium]